ncbi:MAG TPA: chondroitinase-B domain-containing protein [Myxococcota bacterium]|nr:chondroitinase-B domain-containing protein [Myxococcota bacterium]
MSGSIRRGRAAAVRALIAGAVAAVCLASPRGARADDILRVAEVRLDPPTLHALGVQVLITDDDDRDGGVTVRYRAAGTTSWRDGPPLFRVWPETVTFMTVPEQLAGSIFDLAPGTTYEIELHAVDADGPVDETMALMGTTRPVPAADPATARAVPVATATELTAALAAAQPGDVILLADGIYAGSFFTLNASGTQADPIVLRGASEDGVVIDGGGCVGCNVLEVYGSWVHVERLTIQGGERAIRFQGAGAVGNVVRRVHIRDVVHGIGSAPGQADFYVCDNVIEGRLLWPLVYSDDAGLHADDQGVRVDGNGHVVCHNRITGFGDPMINFAEGGRAYDFYGNDISEIYGDGTELDRAEGNVRCWGNRWTNVYTAISMQPIYGGPAYVLRNVVVNVADEQVKLKSVGGVYEPSGAIIWHNTFVSPDLALNLQTPITQHHFSILNNLFVGPAVTSAGRTVDWTAGSDGGRWDFDGYFPDGEFWFGSVAGVNQLYPSFASAMASGAVEGSGVLLAPPLFASGYAAPPGYAAAVAPAPDLTLAPGSNAVDVGFVLAGINAGYQGAGPDLGALELGCPAPLYGPRPEGMEAFTNPVDCGAPTGPSGSDAGLGGGVDGGAAGGDGGPGGAADGGGGAGGGRACGCGCAVGEGAGANAGAAAVAVLIASMLGGFRRRSRRDA